MQVSPQADTVRLSSPSVPLTPTAARAPRRTVRNLGARTWNVSPRRRPLRGVVGDSAACWLMHRYLVPRAADGQLWLRNGSRPLPAPLRQVRATWVPSACQHLAESKWRRRLPPSGRERGSSPASAPPSGSGCRSTHGLRPAVSSVVSFAPVQRRSRGVACSCIPRGRTPEYQLGRPSANLESV